MGKGISRYAPLTGLLAIIFGAVGIVLAQTWADEPGSKATGIEIAAWMTDKSWAIIVSGWLVWLAAAAFLWFLGSLRVLLRRGEGADGRVSEIAWGGGLAAVILFSAMFAPIVAGASAQEFDDRKLSPTLAESLFVLSNGSGFFLALEIAAGVLSLATAVVVLRTAVLPKWYGWLGSIYALWLLIIPIGWIGMIGFPIWILLTTLLVYRAEVKGPSTAAAAAPA